MDFIRGLLGPVGGLVTTIVLRLLGVSSDLTTTAAQTVRDVLAALPARSSPTPELSAAAREVQVRAFTDFAAGMILTWQAARTLATFRLSPLGLLHGLTFVMRAQKQFQEQIALATAALSSIVLLSDTETQDAAIKAFARLGEQLRALSRKRQRSAAIAQAHDEGSNAVGESLAAWRTAARAELERN